MIVGDGQPVEIGCSQGAVMSPLSMRTPELAASMMSAW